MDLDEEEALWRHLAQFSGEEKCHAHPSGLLIYTDGVRCLMEHARASWLIDLIASLQLRACDCLALRDFQLWELHVRKFWSVVVCSRDETSQAFWRVVRGASAELRYLRLFVVAGVLHLPTERLCRRQAFVRDPRSLTSDQTAKPATAHAKKGGNDP